MKKISKNQIVLLTLFLILVILLPVFLIANKNQKLYRSRAEDIISPTPEASPSAQIVLLETMIESKNIETYNLINQYEQTIDEGEKQNIVSNLETNLTERKNNQLSLLQYSPISVYKKAFSKDKIEKIKKISDDQNKKIAIEEYIDEITGTINTTIYDNFDNNTSYTTSTFIPDDNAEEEINFYPADNQTFLSGTKVTLNNVIRIDEDKQVLGVSSVYAEEEEQPQEQNQQPQSHLVAVEIETIETPPLDTLGEQKVLVLLGRNLYVHDEQLPSFQDIETQIKEVNNFYINNSYGQYSINYDIQNKWYDTFLLSKNIKEIAYGDEAKDLVFQELILSAEKDGVDFKKYNNGGIIALVLGKKVNYFTGRSSLGKSNVFVYGNDSIRASLSFLYINPDIFYKKNAAARGLIHEYAHGGLAIGHATRIDCEKSHGIIENAPFVTDSEEKFKIKEVFIGVPCKFYEYGNPFDIMGREAFSNYDFNIYIKHQLGWFNKNNTATQIIKIDTKQPSGTYTIKLAKNQQGYVGAYLPFSSDGNDLEGNIDYFFEYRVGELLNKELYSEATFNREYPQGINFPNKDNYDVFLVNIKEDYLRKTFPDYHFNFLDRTMLFTVQNDDNFSDNFKIGFSENTPPLIDLVNKIKIKVKGVNQIDQTLTFTIDPCDNGERPLYLIPQKAGDNKSVSINIFESDLMNKNLTSLIIDQKIIVANTSDCFRKRYDLTNIIEKRGNTIIDIKNDFEIFNQPILNKSENIHQLSTQFYKNNQSLPDASLSFDLIEKNQSGEERQKSTSYIFSHLIPTPDEYKNDLEPFMIEIKDRDTNNKEFNHLETEKGQTLVFTSKIANNSRNPDGNKSSNFLIKWYIQDDKGNNAIPPFSQPHDGIPPKSIDDANPAILTWTIPQDLKAGDYKVILDVDWNNKLKNEFNENNNIIFRYFSVVE